jgi:hypothetical protein
MLLQLVAFLIVGALMLSSDVAVAVDLRGRVESTHAYSDAPYPASRIEVTIFSMSDGSLVSRIWTGPDGFYYLYGIQPGMYRLGVRRCPDQKRQIHQILVSDTPRQNIEAILVDGSAEKGEPLQEPRAGQGHPARAVRPEIDVAHSLLPRGKPGWVLYIDACPRIVGEIDCVEYLLPTPPNPAKRECSVGDPAYPFGHISSERGKFDFSIKVLLRNKEVHRLKHTVIYGWAPYSPTK